MAEAILRMKDTLRAAGKHCGVVATSDENVQQRLAQGFRAVALGMDAGLLLRSLRASLAGVGRDPAFWRIAVAIGTSQCAAVSTFTLWMGTWLRDVAGFSRGEVAQGQMAAALAIVLGYLSFGWLADMLVRRGRPVLPLFIGGVAVSSACFLLLVLGVKTGSVLTWSVFTYSATAATLAHSIASRRTPVAMAGRVNTALNTFTFLGIFLGQWMVGVILARWPATASGYAPEGYFWGMGVLWVVQAAGLAWLWSGRRLLESRQES